MTEQYTITRDQLARAIGTTELDASFIESLGRINDGHDVVKVLPYRAEAYADELLEEIAEMPRGPGDGLQVTFASLAGALDDFYLWVRVTGSGARVQGQVEDAGEVARALYAGLSTEAVLGEDAPPDRVVMTPDELTERLTQALGRTRCSDYRHDGLSVNEEAAVAAVRIYLRHGADVPAGVARALLGAVERLDHDYTHAITIGVKCDRENELLP